MELQLFSIMPLDTEHTDEICNDVLEQYKSGVSNCVLFKMTLVPEGNPPVDKVNNLCSKYDVFRKRLQEEGLKSGILVQASIGHGWVLSDMFPFQQFTAFDTGVQEQFVCPYDKGFGKYIKNVFSVIASHHPDAIMLDDDFRLMSFRSGDGCCCPLHLAEFNKRAGTHFTREELFEAVHREDSLGDKYNRIMVETQMDSLISCAQLMREGINSVDPTIPGSFCCVGNEVECAQEISAILAGKNNPTVVRINNGFYAAQGAKFITNSFMRAAQSISKLKDKVDVILAETDTCPQNRYSTSAMVLHTHFTGSIIEGVNGAKHWITRFGAYEPESGLAYRQVLSRHRKFYDRMAEIVPKVRWRGLRIPTSDTSNFDYRRKWFGINAWSSCVLERIGLPMFFSNKEGGIACLEGYADEPFSDKELKKLLSGNVFLASDTAEHIIKRGFGYLLGVDVKEWNGKQPSNEMLNFRNNDCNVQYNYREIIPLNYNVKSLSTVYHSVDKVNRESLFPGVTSYKNELGGTVFVFCGTPKTRYSITEAFSFLNYSRKMQLVQIMKSVNELPIYCPDDTEIYFRAGDMQDGGLFCTVFNIGLDTIYNLTLCADRKISTIKQLSENGEYEPVEFTETDGMFTLNLPCHTLDPVVLIIN